jgi:hypothetical protein
MNALRIGLTLTCSETAEECLARLREVLEPIEAAREPWPALEEWERLLPEWFVASCARPMSPEEARSWVEQWRKMSPEEQSLANASQHWSLPDWLYWMEPSHLVWKWADGKVRTSQELEVFLEVDGWPVPLGAFEWLARAAGAKDVRVSV